MKLDQFSLILKKRAIMVKRAASIIGVLIFCLFGLAIVFLYLQKQNLLYFLMIIPVLIVFFSLVAMKKNKKVDALYNSKWKVLEDFAQITNEPSKIIKRTEGRFITFELENKMIVNQNWIEAMDENRIKVFDYCGLKKDELIDLVYLINDKLWLIQKENGKKGIANADNIYI